MVRREGERMILVDVKEGIDVELKGEVMDQLLEFVMITKSLRQSLPEKVKEKLNLKTLKNYFLKIRK